MNLAQKKPSNASKREVREEFIMAKYVQREYCVSTSDLPDALSQRLFEELKGPDLDTSELLKYVILGANLKWVNAEGESLMHCLLRHAAASTEEGVGPVALAQLLTLNDAASDVASRLDGQRPLHIAAQKDFTGVCRILLKAGANASAVDNAGQSPLDWLPIEAHPKKLDVPDIEMYLFPGKRRRSVATPNAAGSPSLSLSNSSSGNFPLIQPQGGGASDSPSLMRKAGGGSARRLSFFGSRKGSVDKSPSSPSMSPITGRKGGSKKEKRLSTNILGRRASISEEQDVTAYPPEEKE
jgi:hypothetical protein